MIRRIAALALGALFFCSASLVAGDVATFVNLGFSEDSRTFMFAQYGIEDETTTPFAEIYTVDVPGNRFVPNGTLTESFDVPLSPGQDGSGALYNLLPEAQPLVERYDLNHLRQGRLVYLLVNGQEPKSRISFRDFRSGNRYEVRLVQEQRGEGASVRAAFHILLTLIREGGAREEYTVGLPDYFREGINRYQIRQILHAPNERGIVFVVEKITDTGDGREVRFMVETVAFR
jgi:predicted secreted protein